MKKLGVILLLVISAAATAQTTFWTESFSNGCTAACSANGYAGPNGTWTQTITGVEGVDANEWFVSCAENNTGVGNCSSGCGNNQTLHISAAIGNPFCPNDCGAAYDAGGLCGILTCPQTDRRIESPVINCSAQSNISISFEYIAAGSPPNDQCTLWYFDGITWSQLSTLAPTNNSGCGGQGRWATFASVALPASANNNANVKIGFRWINNDDGAGSDPSIAIDNVILTVPSSGLPPVAAFTASATTVCEGQPVNFTDNSTNTPTGWSWTFPGGTPATGNTQNVTGVVWNVAGSYTVTLIATNGNGSDTTTQVITVVANPVVTTFASPTTICVGQSSTLTAAGATTYNWMPGNLTGSSVSVTPAVTTTYTVTGTTGSCTDTAQVTVVVQVCAAPVAAFTALPANTCVGSPINFLDNSTGGPTSWSWTFPGAIPPTSNVQNPTGVVWTAPGSYTVTLIVSNVNGSDTTTQVISVSAGPSVTATTLSPAICNGASATLNASGALTYLWQPGNLTGNPVTVNPSATTTYTVVGTDAGGCIDTGMVNVVVNPAPNVTATSLNAQICAGDSATIIAGGAVTYTWQPGGLTGASQTVAPATTTTYTVNGTDANGCSATAMTTVIVQVCTLPVAAATTSDNTICEGTCIDFNDVSTGNVTAWNWVFQGGTPATSTQQNPTSICYSTAGTYSVVLIVTNIAGNDTTVLTIDVGAPAAIDAGPFAQIAIGNSTTLNATGGSGSYSWSPGTGLSCTGCASPTASPTVTTTYTVTMTDSYGCQSSDTVTVEVIEKYDLFIPSAFSPNGDGHNDMLYVRGAGIKELQFFVFSRIGEKVFETTDKNMGWDGVYRGLPMNTGVFTYYVKATFYNNTSEVKKGDITLVR